jgi:NTE family protein
MILGTSAGSVVGSLLRSPEELQMGYDAQLDETEDHEIGADIDLMALATTFGEAFSGVTSPAAARARVAAAALTAKTLPPEVRRAVIAARLPSHDWPDYDLRITAIEAPSGEPVVFDRNAGIDLVDAVAASCAVPIVWPAVTINGRTYIDGGLRSTTNADLADGYDRVLVIAPYPPVASPLGPGIAAEIAPLERSGRVLVVAPDDVAQAAFGLNPLDPSTRRPSALAGRDYGKAVLDDVRELWM